MKITTLLLLMILSLSFQSIQAETFNIRDRIKYQETYLNIYKTVFSKDEIVNENAFKEKVLSITNIEKKKIILRHYQELSSYFPELILRAIIYFRHIKENQEILANLLHYSFLNKLMVLRDKIDLTASNEIGNAQKVKYLNLIKEITEHNSFNIKKIFEEFDLIFKEKALAISGMLDHENFITALKETTIVNFSFNDIISEKDFYQLSHLGVIPGNKVQLITDNQTDLDMMNWYNEHSITDTNAFDPNLPHIKMPTKQDSTGHPAFKSPIFSKVRDMINMAKETIFIDISLIGGTLGGTIAEYLIDQTKEKLLTNPKFKVVLLHDSSVNNELKDEVLPILKYIKERIIEDQQLEESIFFLQANIQRHPSGIPLKLGQYLQKNKQTFSLNQNLGSNYKSKIDNSKVMVIDGNSNHPLAYLGSKNWTDHSGGYHLDHAIHIEGPAASLIQHSYLRDIQAALTTDLKETQFFPLQKEGFSNSRYQGQEEEILSYFKITKEEVPFRGSDRVRLAEADIDGSIKNIRNIIVDMIKNSNKNIYLEQLFLFDKYIVDSLIKKKIENKSIDIRIILDSNENVELGGLPNTIFIKELKKYGIQVRFRKIQHSENQSDHQENHRKIISTDGNRIMIGSANLNPNSLQGSYREMGAEVFSRKIARDYEISFLSTWSDSKKVMDLDIENLQVEIKNKRYSKAFSSLLNDIAAFLIRSKDRIEKRN